MNRLVFFTTGFFLVISMTFGAAMGDCGNATDGSQPLSSSLLLLKDSLTELSILQNPTPEQKTLLKQRVIEFKNASEENARAAVAAAAALSDPGSCGTNKTVADCLQAQIVEKQSECDVVSEAACNQRKSDIKDLQAQLDVPQSLNQRAKALSSVSSGLSEMLTTDDYSFTSHLQNVWNIFHDSWKYMITPGPLVAVSVGGAAYIASDEAGLNQAAKNYYSDSSKRWTPAEYEAGTQIGYAYCVILPAYLIGKLTQSEKIMNTADTMTAAVGLETVLTETLKFSFIHSSIGERPDGSGNDGFPSFHASTAFSMATVLDQMLGHKIGIPAYIVASYVGMSRIGQDVHSPGQVIFGTAIGIASGLAASRAEKERETGKKQALANFFTGTKTVKGTPIDYSWAPAVDGTTTGAVLNLSWK